MTTTQIGRTHRYKNIPGSGRAYDSYSKCQNTPGDPKSDGGFWGITAPCIKLTQITSAARAFVFVVGHFDFGAYCCVSNVDIAALNECSVSLRSRLR